MDDPAGTSAKYAEKFAERQADIEEAAAAARDAARSPNLPDIPSAEGASSANSANNSANNSAMRPLEASRAAPTSVPRIRDYGAKRRVASVHTITTRCQQQHKDP